MELTVLVDNNTIIDKYLLGEAGLSYYIKENDKTILFDLGYSDILIQNANRLNLDLNEVDNIVLSHGHLDHTGGLEPLIKYYYETKENGTEDYPEIIAHPDCFKEKFYKDSTSIGINLSKKLLNKLFVINEYDKPYWITDKLLYLGQIERNNEFEAQKPLGYQKDIKEENRDYILDDTALAYISKNGLVIITGCSHSGICNIVEQAKRVTGVDNVVDIIGGLHLMEPAAVKLGKTKQYIKELNLEKLHACHCTDLKSKIELSKIANLKEVGVGMKFKYE
ncbi:MAG: MBL fold metallo-hydrolase [Halanaerobiales bacterium]|nr:MBL fold metallo-hydrolase [Halanaerobiales bacterium]